MKYYKVLDKGGKPFNGGHGRWHLPKNGKPGKWMRPIKGVVPCVRGYHLCRRGDLLSWLGPEIYEAEGRGARVAADDKVVFSEARLLRKVGGRNERTARLFAADCAERVLPLFEKERPDDDRPRKTIEAARAFARGEIKAAAWAAAKAAAKAAAWDAAKAAAWDAARAAAKAAAWDAAWAAARDAAKAAAWAAAGDAAWDAAWAAAGDAERKWQTKRLFEYLSGKRS